MAADRSVLAKSTITRLQVHAPAGVVRISAEGAGEEVCGAALICPDRLPPAATVERMSAALVGRPLADRERLWRDLRAAAAGSDPAGLAGVDIALWDLWSKALRLPLYRAIGGFRTEIPACLSGTAACDTDDAATEAAMAVRDGYRGYRVTGTVTPIGAKAPAAVRKRVLDAVHAVRDAVPEDFPLLYGVCRIGASAAHPADTVEEGRAGPETKPQASLLGRYRGAPAGGHLEALAIGRALDEARNPAADHGLDPRQAVRLQAVLRQENIERRADIGRRIDQGAVQIPDDGARKSRHNLAPAPRRPLETRSRMRRARRTVRHRDQPSPPGTASSPVRRSPEPGAA